MKNNLRVLRAQREWSQADLASRLDVSRQTVNAIETEKYDPSLPLAFKIARLFDRHIEDIFDPEERHGPVDRSSEVPAPSGAPARSGALRRRSGASSA
jgi:putative transcriptional regulator